MSRENLRGQFDDARLLPQPERAKINARNKALYDMKQRNVIRDHGAINEGAISAIVATLIGARFNEDEVVAIFIEGYFTSPSGVVDYSARDSQIIKTVREAYKSVQR